MRVFYEWTERVFKNGFKLLEKKSKVINTIKVDKILTIVEAGWWVHEGLLFSLILDNI